MRQVFVAKDSAEAYTAVELLDHMVKIEAPKGARSRASSALRRLVLNQMQALQIIKPSTRRVVNPQQGIGVPVGQQRSDGD